MAAAVVAIGLVTGCGSTSGTLSGGSMDDEEWRRVVDGAAPAVARLEVQTPRGTASGTGWVAGAGLLVTNAHVVEGARGIDVVVPGAPPGRASVGDMLPDDDLATVETAGTTAPSLSLADADPVPGDLVQALGYPLGGPFRASPGRVIDYVDGSRFDVPGCVLRASVDLRPGNSGGPLLDTEGRVAGVVFAIEVEEGVALALPVSRLASVLDRGGVTARC